MTSARADGRRAAALDRLLSDLVGSGTASAAVGLVGRVGPDGGASLEWEGAAGWARPGLAAGVGTLFDLGSLTKPFVATLALLLDATGELPLAEPSGALLGQLAAGGAGVHEAGVSAGAVAAEGRRRAAGAGASAAGGPAGVVAPIGSGRPAGAGGATGRGRPEGVGAPAGRGRPADAGAATEAVALAARELARRPLSDLLRHRSGLAAWTPLYHRCAAVREVEALLAGGTLLGARPGTYSDLDVLLWARLAERRLGEPLAALLARRVLAPLGLDGVEVAPGERPGVAVSRCDTAREVELAARQGIALAPLGPPPAGRPLDGNARFLLDLGWGLPGHSGLFGRAGDLWRLGAEWLGPRRLLHPAGVAAALAGTGPFALGWWRRRVKGGGGGALSPGSFGHTGFPGGNLWIDPAARRVMVLLAHRASAASDMNRWRRRFHAAALKEP
jgi:CubicO group peptidase (beta-lactamase class C family)